MDAYLFRAIDISGPRIVLGDFNDWTHGLVTRTLSPGVTSPICAYICREPELRPSCRHCNSITSISTITSRSAGAVPQVQG
jgi:hypothetical protein